MNDWFEKAYGSRLDELRRYTSPKKEERRRELTRAELKRRDKLQGIAARLRDGKNVQNRQLQTWLTAVEYAEFDSEWQEQLELRDEAKHKPEEIKEYEELLRLATFYFNRSESYSCRGNSKSARKFWHKCEAVCERAVEFLEEALQADPALNIWFDRNISFDAAAGIDADLVSLPRVLTSRSINKLNADSRIMTKLEVKLSAVERAIKRIGIE